MNISGGYADSLAGYAQRYGLSGAMARNLLAINQVSFPPRYFLPGELNPRSKQEKDDQMVEEIFVIRPNPASDFIEIFSHVVSDDPMFFDVISMDGQRMIHGRLTAEISRIDIQDLPSGIYVVKVHDPKGGVIGTNKVLKIGVR